MNYTIRTANNIMPVKDYFILLFNKLVEDYESVYELFDEYYNENEIGEMASDEKEIIVKNFAEVFYHDTIWYDGDISIVAVCDDDGNEITAEELDSNHQEYFKMIDKLEKQYYQKSVQYYLYLKYNNKLYNKEIVESYYDSNISVQISTQDTPQKFFEEYIKLDPSFTDLFEYDFNPIDD